MDRYQKVEKPKPESPVNQNEIRITSQGLVRNYISYATTLLQEREVTEIVLKAMGQAISKTVAVAEIIKRRIPRLHQDSTISSVSITDTFEPIEEGLEIVEQTRHVSMISITLSTKDLNKNSPGGNLYAWPLIDIKLHQILIKLDSNTIIRHNNVSLLDKHVEVTTLVMEIHMDGEGDVVEKGAEAGTEVDILTTKRMVGGIKVGILVVMVGIMVATREEIGVAIHVEMAVATREEIGVAIHVEMAVATREEMMGIRVPTQVDTLTGDEVVGVGVGAIEVMDMEGAEVEAAEGLCGAVEGWGAVVVVV
ncbi:alba DNA/RNA-binding protein [Striga asiatica]|uniref:Alba DNA/RNA-binding protein n=1 Tax=Striga asiatica TaxID=4170 RepID=A0A5A7QLV7_STRAF|nr:alba DNA/RNA-binding protein [Striga asiatica]